nr:cyclic beta 1-2 glucan synthetase [Bacteroidota bacterium]
MTSNPIQDFFSQIRIPFLGENLLRKYENDKSPLRAEIFTTLQLEQYATSLAAQHLVAKGVGPEPLIKRLNENEEILIEVRSLVVESVNENHPTTPAAEWLLDNFYLIEEQIRIGKKHFPKGYSETLPKLSKGLLAGYPRVYSIALEIISHSDGRVDLDNLYAFVNAYQKVAPLNLGELWAIPIMLRLALIENLRRLAAQIAIDRLHKNLADSWADRMIDVAEKDPKSLIVVTADMARSDPPVVSSFVAEITRRLLGKGPALTLPLTWIEQRLSENGLTTNSLVHQETQKQAAAQVSISNSIGSLRFLNNTDWRDFVENTSAVEQILRNDTNGTYERMDFFTRDHYRHVVERVALRSELPETAIASIAISLAKSESSYLNVDPRHQHVGYYLVGNGLRQTEKNAGIKLNSLQKFRSSVCSIPFFWYGNSIIIITLVLTVLLVHHEYKQDISTGWLVVAGLIFLFATSYLATAIVNWIATILIKPDFLPRMNYAYGIPPESKTFVVVPTLFGSIPELEGLIETMEVRYLSTRQENLHFALLTDFKDAVYEINDEEKKLLVYADQRIREINKKYQRESNDAFFLFHRPRKWNEADKIWMGYERKRGKLGDLNALLRGHSDNAFQMIVGDQDILQQVRYIITLDADTQLPRESAWKIVGTIAHPLNQPFFDVNKGRVTAGYGILQPRVATSLPEGSGSWYSRIHASDFGIDPYTRAVSDVYQDVLKEGSFIGKGIYDVNAFEQAVGNRFPENRILSHDLLEGCHARSGLTTDVQLYEEYPSAYLVDMKRRHRWIRGDWQIGRWLFPRVPAPGKKTQKNVLSAISRWKIFDNLRRSLVPPAFLLMFLYGWIISDTPWFWTFTVIGIILPPSIFSFTWNILNKSKDIEWANHVTAAVEALINSVLQHIWTIISLPYETHVNLDAISRTLWRMYISKKNLLQWDPFGATSGLKSLPSHITKMWIGSAGGIALFLFLSLISWPAFIVASPIVILWIVSPVIAWWISIPLARRQTHLSNPQQVFLRKLSRKTWAYFEQFIGPEDNWLPPDNFQEYPTPRIAHRTSPTNMGISLLSSLAAYDFGFISSGKLVERCNNALASMHNMARYEGHFFNWYDTLTLSPLMPRYVSTVDSGNLAASLLVLKEGLLSLPDDPIIHIKILDGIQDTLWVLRDKVKDPLILQKMQRDLQLACANLPLSISGVKLLLEKTIATIQEINVYEGRPEESEIDWWLQSFLNQCQGSYEDLMLLIAWKLPANIPPILIDILTIDTVIPSLFDVERKTTTLLTRLKEVKVNELTTNEQVWFNEYQTQLTSAQAAAKTRMDLINTMVTSCVGFADYE